MKTAEEPLRSMDIHKIVDVFNKRLDVSKYAVCPVRGAREERIHLNCRANIDSQTPEDLQDIAGHLQGGIPPPMSMCSSATGCLPAAPAHSVQGKADPVTSILRGEGGHQVRHLRARRVHYFIVGMNAHSPRGARRAP